MSSSLEQRVGQLFWCGWGAEPEPDPRRVNDHARVLLEELHAGGVVLFSRNVGIPVEAPAAEDDAPIPSAASSMIHRPAEIAALTAELRARSACPPLIGIDQEGGRVCRLLIPGMIFPGSMALGSVDDPTLTHDVHRAMGEQLAALGIDVDFAPCLDVNNNPDNPIIGVRSFGEKPERVARHGVAAVQGLRDAGVLPVVKHFPGHGDTSADSHLELPVQPAGRSRLDAVELVPFRAAIESGAPAVMTTHILFPALDPELPATLSHRILTGLLREELGFDGLIVTDCMEMRGITGRWGPEQAAVLALQAGADMLLVCHTLEVQRRMHAAVCDAVRSGALSEARLRASVQRVEAARTQTARIRERAPDLELPGSARYRRLEERATEAALALAGEQQLRAPFARGLTVVVAGAASAVRDFAETLGSAGFTVERRPCSGAVPDGLETAPQLLWLVSSREPFADGRPPQAVYEALRRHARAVVVAVREPYCLERYPPEVPRLAAWGGQIPHRRAVLRWIEGRLNDVRRLPV